MPVEKPQPTSSGIISRNATAADRGIPRYKHIFVIIAENKAYRQSSVALMLQN
jgi:hypothetical protein